MPLPFIQLYVGDVLKKTDVLTPAAFGGYTRLLFKLHASETPGEVSYTLNQLKRVFAATTIEETTAILNEITLPEHNILQVKQSKDRYIFTDTAMKKAARIRKTKSLAGKLGAAVSNQKRLRNKEIAEQFAPTFDAAKNSSKDSP